MPLPESGKIDPEAIGRNYQQIKQDVENIVEMVMEKVLNDPAREHLVVKK